MCRRPVRHDASAFVEHGELIHVECHLGLMDAAGAVARLVRARPEQPICLTCAADALMITVGEAEAAAARLRALPGFAMRVETCVGCGRRRQAVRALRTLRPPARSRRRRSAGGAQ